MAFTDREKSRMRHFLSYPDWLDRAVSLSLGFPSASLPAYLVNAAFDNLQPGGEESCRKDLCELEQIEAQRSEERKNASAVKIGNLLVDPKQAFDILDRERVYWTRRLADDLGAVPDPYSNAEYRGLGGGSRNARVE